MELQTIQGSDFNTGPLCYSIVRSETGTRVVVTCTVKFNLFKITKTLFLNF